MKESKGEGCCRGNVTIAQPIGGDVIEMLGGLVAAIIHFDEPVPAHVFAIQVEVTSAESRCIEQQHLPFGQRWLVESRLIPSCWLARYRPPIRTPCYFSGTLYE